MSKLLISEHPLQVLPTLAQAIGLNEAIFLQQLHYWLTPDNIRGYAPHYKEFEGETYPWIYNTYEKKTLDSGRVVGWEANFPFWSARTISRIVASLREKNLIITTDKFNIVATNRTLWYTINYEEIDKLEKDLVADSSVPTCHTEPDKLARSREGQVGTLMTETTTETTTETPLPDKPSNGSGLPIALDGHQQAIDKASGGTTEDPSDGIGQHLYWGFMEGPVPIPRGKKEWGKWREGGRRLLSRLPQPWDLQAISQRIDEWFVDEEIENFWKNMPCKDEALDLIARYVIQPKPEIKQEPTTWRWKDEPA